MDSTANWATTFFSLTSSPWSPTERQAMVDGLEMLLKLPAGASILDVACADGGLAVELARRGYAVTGLDLSAQMLAEARSTADAVGVDLDWIQADMLDLPTDRGYDAVLSFCWAFGYFDDAGNQRFLDRAYAALRPGGQLLIDTHVVETLTHAYNKRVWRQSGEVLYLEDRLWNPSTGRVETIVTRVSDTGRESAQAFIRVYTYRQFQEMLQVAGFAVSQGFSGYLLPNQDFGGITSRPFELGSQRCVMVARK